MNKILGPFVSGRAAVALLLIRLVFGVGIVLHGWDKVIHGGPFHWADEMGSLSNIPHPLQALATCAEVGGGIALIGGFLTPLAMLGLAVTMTVALYKGHLVAGEGFVSLDRPFKPTYEIVAHFLIVAVAFLLSGPGTLSLDYLLFGRKKSAGTAMVP